MLRLLIPAYQQAAKPMKPTMTAIHHCTLARFTRDLLRFLAALSNVCHHAHKIARTSSSSYPCPNTSVAVAPPSAAVAPRKCSPASHAMSWRRAPSIVTPMGTPCPSIVNDRLTPAFLRSVGFGPVFPPAALWSLLLSHAQSMPFSSSKLDADLPQLQKHASSDPCAKAIIGRGFAHRSVPFSAAHCAQHIKDGVGALAVGHARATAAKPMCIHVNRQEQLQHRPEFVRDAKAGVVRLFGVGARVRFGVGWMLMPVVCQLYPT